PRAAVSRMAGSHSCQGFLVTLRPQKPCRLPKREHRCVSDLPQPARNTDSEWITEADIIRAAKLVMSLRGATAAHHALRRAGDLQLAGSVEAEAMWRRIAQAIKKLEAAAE